MFKHQDIHLQEDLTLQPICQTPPWEAASHYLKAQTSDPTRLRCRVAQSHAAQPCLSSCGISRQEDSPTPTRCKAGLVPASPVQLRTNALHE